MPHVFILKDFNKATSYSSQGFAVLVSIRNRNNATERCCVVKGRKYAMCREKKVGKMRSGRVHT